MAKTMNDIISCTESFKRQIHGKGFRKQVLYNLHDSEQCSQVESCTENIYLYHT